MALTIGHDAEVFVRNQQGIITSIIGHLGGTKDEPLPVNFGALQEDNVLAELNIDAAETAEQFVYRTLAVMQQLEERLPAGWTTEIISSHHYRREQLISFGEKAMEFGCTPDFNCWTLEKNEISSPYTTLRTAGGHIHIGFDNVTAEEQVKVMRMCDYYLGIPSVLLDGDTERRTLYGKAGAFRYKKYGAEYRTMSNFWMREERLMRWAFSNAQRCYIERDRLTGLMRELPAAELQSIINRGDAVSAAHWINELGIVMP